ncbi:MAG TPA: hypothetical protein VE287_01940, partial [Actinopolymorphaceae bacterium]|nr:hypothetical protein [Actinopolymorphaceae bacterium]
MEHLGIYADLVDAARRQSRLRPPVGPGPALQREIRDVLGFADDGGVPDDVRLERSWEDDGLAGEEVSWSLGYGPRTRAWVLRPRDATGPLPGVVALHCHSGVKTYGKEKIARGPQPVSADVLPLHELYYGGRPWANALARQGFVVVVPDAFLWSSRRFPLETMPERMQKLGALSAQADGVPDQAYERAARLHE